MQENTSSSHTEIIGVTNSNGKSAVPKKGPVTKKKAKLESVDALALTAKLGITTHGTKQRISWSQEEDEKIRNYINNHLINHGYLNGILDLQSPEEYFKATKIMEMVNWEDLTQKQFSLASISADNNNNGSSPTLRKRKCSDLKKRWSNFLNPNLKRGRWTPEEDQLLLIAYEKHGQHWSKISKEIPRRNLDQCSKRYYEALDPKLSVGRLRNWTEEEDLRLISRVQEHGTKWKTISMGMESRPSLTCRNRWRKILTSVIRNKATIGIKTAIESIPATKETDSMSPKVDEDGANYSLPMNKQNERNSSMNNYNSSKENTPNVMHDYQQRNQTNRSTLVHKIPMTPKFLHSALTNPLSPSLSLLDIMSGMKTSGSNNNNNKNNNNIDSILNHSEKSQMMLLDKSPSPDMMMELPNPLMRTTSNLRTTSSTIPNAQTHEGLMDNNETMSSLHLSRIGRGLSLRERIPPLQEEISDSYDTHNVNNNNNNNNNNNDNNNNDNNNHSNINDDSGNSNPGYNAQNSNNTNDASKEGMSNDSLFGDLKKKPTFENPNYDNLSPPDGFVKSAHSSQSQQQEKQEVPTFSSSFPTASVKSFQQTEWKFALKDKGYTLSSGTISSTELAEQLIEQAKLHNLKISIHQHIHNHYGSGGNNTNDLIFNNNNNNSKYNFTTHNPNTVSSDGSMESPNNNNNNNYAGSMHSGSNNNYRKSNGNAIGQAGYSSSVSMQQQQSASTPNSTGVPTPKVIQDLTEIGHNRFKHFKTLKSSLRPKLSSSGHSSSYNDVNKNSNGVLKKRRKHPKASSTGSSYEYSSAGSSSASTPGGSLDTGSRKFKKLASSNDFSSNKYFSGNTFRTSPQGSSKTSPQNFISPGEKPKPIVMSNTTSEMIMDDIIKGSTGGNTNDEEFDDEDTFGFLEALRNIKPLTVNNSANTRLMFGSTLNGEGNTNLKTKSLEEDEYDEDMDEDLFHKPEQEEEPIEFDYYNLPFNPS